MKKWRVFTEGSAGPMDWDIKAEGFRVDSACLVLFNTGGTTGSPVEVCVTAYAPGYWIRIAEIVD
jgi:hypothetical protein